MLGGRLIVTRSDACRGEPSGEQAVDKVILQRADGSLKDTYSYPGEGASKYYR